jgi:hypothetical protein
MSAASPTRSTKPTHRRSSIHSHSAGLPWASGRHPHTNTHPTHKHEGRKDLNHNALDTRASFIENYT